MGDFISTLAPPPRLRCVDILIAVHSDGAHFRMLSVLIVTLYSLWYVVLSYARSSLLDVCCCLWTSATISRAAFLLRVATLVPLQLSVCTYANAFLCWCAGRQGISFVPHWW